MNDANKETYQIFKCDICNAWFIYFNGKMRNLEDMDKNNEIMKHFKEGSD